MSNEEKLKRDRHERMRKIWSIIFIVEIVLNVLALAFILYINHTYSKVICVNYTETPKANYEVSLIDTSDWDKVTEGKIYETLNIDKVVAKFNYEMAVPSKSADYTYDYTVEKYIIYSAGKGLESDKLYIEEISEPVTGAVSSASKLTVPEIVVILDDFQTINNIAVEDLERIDYGSLTAHLYVEVKLNVNVSCGDFVGPQKETAKFVLKTQLATPVTSIVNGSDAADDGSNEIACTKDGMIATTAQSLILPLGVALAFFVLVLIIFLTFTKNKDVDYANKIKSILRGYKSFIQVSTSKFTSNGFVVYRIGSITEMLEIRDTVQKPVIMIENEDKTCSKFFIVDGEVMYLYGLCVEGYEELLYDNNPTPAPAYTEPTPVVEEKVEEEIVEDEIEDEEEDDEDEEEVVEDEIEEVNEPTSIEVVEEDDEETKKLLKMCSYTFEAKLILAEPEMKDFYREIAGYALSYGVKVVRSAKRERIYLGRKLFANLTFSGKKLVVAMALNPADYVDSKYKFKDMSEVKKFAETPFVMKVTSGLKVRHIKELLTVMFEGEGLVNQNLDIKINKIPTKSKKTLIKEGLIKVNEKAIK